MKLQPDRLDVQSILGYGPGWVGLASQGVAEKIHSSVLIGSRGERQDWLCKCFEDLTASRLMSLRIGLETMDTLAACRTYNILAGEGRHVIAALLIEPSA